MELRKKAFALMRDLLLYQNAGATPMNEICGRAIDIFCELNEIDLGDFYSSLLIIQSELYNTSEGGGGRMDYDKYLNAINCLAVEAGYDLGMEEK